MHLMKILTIYTMNSHLLTLKAHNYKMYVFCLPLNIWSLTDKLWTQIRLLLLINWPIIWNSKVLMKRLYKEYLVCSPFFPANNHISLYILYHLKTVGSWVLLNGVQMRCQPATNISWMVNNKSFRWWCLRLFPEGIEPFQCLGSIMPECFTESEV